MLTACPKFRESIERTQRVHAELDLHGVPHESGDTIRMRVQRWQRMQMENLMHPSNVRKTRAVAAMLWLLLMLGVVVWAWILHAIGLWR